MSRYKLIVNMKQIYGIINENVNTLSIIYLKNIIDGLKKRGF